MHNSDYTLIDFETCVLANLIYKITMCSNMLKVKKLNFKDPCLDLTISTVLLLFVCLARNYSSTIIMYVRRQIQESGCFRGPIPEVVGGQVGLVVKTVK